MEAFELRGPRRELPVADRRFLAEEDVGFVDQVQLGRAALQPRVLAGVLIEHTFEYTPIPDSFRATRVRMGT